MNGHHTELIIPTNNVCDSDDRYGMRSVSWAFRNLLLDAGADRLSPEYSDSSQFSIIIFNGMLFSRGFYG